MPIQEFVVGTLRIRNFMLPRFKHFLITRFNLQIVNTPKKGYSHDVIAKSRKVCLDREWIDKRVELFETYCKPSVLGQTCQDFTWLILVHAATPPLKKGLFDGATVIYSVNPDFIAASEVMWQETRGLWIDDNHGVKFVISTALDSDDAISTDYIEEVQKAYRGKREFINLEKGIVVAHHRGFQYIGDRKSGSVNHFRSLVEHKDNIHSVYAVSHGAARKFAPVQTLDTPARWLEVIHGDNCSNRFHKNRQDQTRPP